MHAHLHIDLLPIKNRPPTHVLFRRSARQQSISESANEATHYNSQDPFFRSCVDIA
jgi:hypothetical protein